MATTASSFSTQTIVAYAVGYLLAAVTVVLGLAMPSLAWLVFGIWLAASLTVLVIDRAVGERTPRPGTAENFGAIFYGSPVALGIIALLAVVAFVVAITAGR